MNSHLFPHIGKVIASTGSRHFPRMLHDLIRTQLAVDATHIRQMRVEPVGHAPLRSELESLKEAALLAETVYSELSSAPPCPDPERETSPVTDASQLHLTRRTDGYRYVISVYRNGASKRFSAHERSLLQDISPVLLPMVEKHINALQPASTDAPAEQSRESAVQGMETLRLRFCERMNQLGLSLSNRELEVCVGLLAGRTAPELAEQLQLKVNTVESYLKRAAIKLGISGRHSLMRWMYSPQNSSDAA